MSNAQLLAVPAGLRRAERPTRADERPQRDYGNAVTSSLGEERPIDLEARFAAGGDAVLREAYDLHGGLVYNLCRRSVGDAHAADVSQEVWVAAWRSRHRYAADRGSLAGWLVGIARFKTLDHLRRSARTEARSALDDAALDRLAVSVDDRDEPIDAVAERLLMAEALRQLEPRPRAVLELAFYSDATHQEIAERTGVPLGTVKSDIRRGLEKLRRHLEGFDAADRP